ncbi:HAD hydrolase-like protein [Streptomyces spiramenti]|uniref:HAD hydrolase-like protein n=1 Tax=Streptomyces spiramenti TaxID=2720606 RepID=A0ABX1APN2_9ACTN|nr:HAD hydrolase-like protein [Streptomyces spiramenti]NJP69053.1 HAD hydrolase-like protein [Streptomyces spiramenti]
MDAEDAQGTGQATIGSGLLPAGSDAPLAERHDTALLDLDGVVYVGGAAVEHAVPSLLTAARGGMRLAYVTNNAARTPEVVAAHLAELGLPAVPSEVVTSAQAVARLVSEAVPAGSRVLYAGAEGLRSALAERGLVPVESADEEPVAVVQGYGGPELPWGRLVEAALAVGRGLPWFASNTDLTIPTPRGVGPGNGAAVEVVRIGSGGTREPVVAGKPQPPMHRESVIRTGARTPLVVGDRLDTDIEGAHNGGVDSLLVLTGVTDAAALVAAPPHHRPTYVAADLRGLLAPIPGPVDEGGAWRCGGMRAAVDGGTLVLTGRGQPLDGLRALCAAAWSTSPDGPSGLDAAEAVAALGL